MTTLIKNGAPKFIPLGAQDISAATSEENTPVYPVNFPHLYIYAQRGRLEPLALFLSQAYKEYGDETFNERSVYFNHQTVFATKAFGPKANKMLLQRLKPDDANDPATLVLWVDVLEADLPVYQREADGSYTYVDGALVDTGTTVAGVKLLWSVVPLDRDGGETLKGLQTKPGTMAGTLDGSPVTSTLYPILPLEVSSFGAYGNNIGIRPYAPTLSSTTPVDEDLIDDQSAYLYRIQMVEKATTSTTPVVTRTADGDNYVEFMLKPGAVNTKLNSDLYIDDVVISAYKPETLYAADYYDDAPFGQLYVYQDNIDTVLGKMYAAETAEGTLDLPTTADAKYIMNLFSATTYDDVPYYAVQVAGVDDGGVIFTETSTHYAAGGSDGTMNDTAFAALVKHQLDNYGELEYDIANALRYPASSYWDTGFPLETKYSFFNILNKRSDAIPFVCTQDVNEELNTASEDGSVAVSLVTRARAYPESTWYGTPTARAALFGWAGKLMNSNYKKNVPLLIEFAAMYAGMLGSESPLFNERKAFDTPSGKKLSLIDPATTNVVTLTESLRNKNWANGLVYAEYCDRNQLAFTQFQTVHEDDTSALNTILTASALCLIDRVCRQTHIDLSGTTKFETELEFLEEADRRTTEALQKILSERFTFSVQSEGNDPRGYVWYTKVYLGANIQKTVNVQTTIVHRKDTGV